MHHHTLQALLEKSLKFQMITISIHVKKTAAAMDPNKAGLLLPLLNYRSPLEQYYILAVCVTLFSR